jgi:hypothetical protein
VTWKRTFIQGKEIQKMLQWIQMGNNDSGQNELVWVACLLTIG